MKKILSLALCFVMIITMFAGCGKPKDKNNNVVNGKFTEYLVAEKVGTINRDNFTTAEGGLFYKDDNGLYGVISYEGLRDTGAIYADVQTRGKYFQVYKKAIKSSSDIAGINASMLIDGKGNVIIPEGYASFYVLNDRYILTSKVTERTYSEDDVVASLTDNGTCVSGKYISDASWYKGSWYVYDVVNKSFVPNATGTKDVVVTARGQYITFQNDNGDRITVDSKGVALSEDAKLFDDGSYKVESKIGEVYDANGNKLFAYDLTGFIPSSVSGDYYIASKYVDGTSKHAIMDKKGNVISTEFDDYITVYGEVVKCGNKIYNLKGKVLLEGEYESVYYDDMFGQNWIVRNEDYYTMIDKTGAVFFNGPFDDEHTVWTDDFLSSEERDGEYYYYSHKDRDFTIKGYHFAPWIVKTLTSNNMYDLVDTMTGKKLLEGYSDYSHISRNALAYYVYAEYNGGADVYLVVSSAQLEEVSAKKANLFNDLIAAFKAEGINVTVNTENGEISMDSSVLFGGDSSELTAEGKAFLNKFIKAYASVVYSEKYNGFISKTMVEGHTAPVEGSTYASGLQLSQERAENVKKYCLSSETNVNISKFADTLEAVGYSNSQPIYDSNGNVDMEASRRVSFRFLVNIEF